MEINYRTFVVGSLIHAKGFSFRSVQCSFCGRKFRGIVYICEAVHGDETFCCADHLYLDGHYDHKQLLDEMSELQKSRFVDSL